MSGILQSIIDIGHMVLKILAVVAIVAAIKAFLGVVFLGVFPPIVSELLGLISMFLPWNALAVFDAFCTGITAILVFLIARKIFELTSWSFSTVS